MKVAPESQHFEPKPRHELRLTFDELVLIHKTLQAVKTLRALPPGDELVDDTMQIVDQALVLASHEAA